MTLANSSKSSEMAILSVLMVLDGEQVAHGPVPASGPHLEYCLCPSWHTRSKRIILMQNICHIRAMFSHKWSLPSTIYNWLDWDQGRGWPAAYELWPGLKRWAGPIIFLSVDLDWISAGKTFFFLSYPKALYMLKIGSSRNWVSFERWIGAGKKEEDVKYWWITLQWITKGSKTADTEAWKAVITLELLSNSNIY